MSYSHGRKRIVVIGAGIIGMSTAYRLQTDLSNVEVVFLNGRELCTVFITRSWTVGIFLCRWLLWPKNCLRIWPLMVRLDCGNHTTWKALMVKGHCKFDLVRSFPMYYMSSVFLFQWFIFLVTGAWTLTIIWYGLLTRQTDCRLELQLSNTSLSAKTRKA